MEEEVGFGLARSRLTAIQRFVSSDFIAFNKSASASAHSRYNLTDKFESGNVEIIYGAFEFKALPQV